jgi:hypothetical protein
MKIAIDVNGVLRDTICKIEQVYRKYFLDNIENYDTPKTYNIDISGQTTENETLERFNYEINLPVQSLNLMDHFKFKSEEEYYTFLYEDFTMEIFGHSPSTELTTFDNLNETYKSLKDDYEFMIISNEIGKSKPATLFFLSKFGCLIDEIKFFNNISKKYIWDLFDILLTSNPELLLKENNEKIVIKYETDYNKNIITKYNIKQIKELPEILKKINYDKNI